MTIGSIPQLCGLQSCHWVADTSAALHQQRLQWSLGKQIVFGWSNLSWWAAPTFWSHRKPETLDRLASGSLARAVRPRPHWLHQLPWSCWQYWNSAGACWSHCQPRTWSQMFVRFIHQSKSNQSTMTLNQWNIQFCQVSSLGMLDQWRKSQSLRWQAWKNLVSSSSPPVWSALPFPSSECVGAAAVVVVVLIVVVVGPANLWPCCSAGHLCFFFKCCLLETEGFIIIAIVTKGNQHAEESMSHDQWTNDHIQGARAKQQNEKQKMICKWGGYRIIWH